VARDLPLPQLETEYPSALLAWLGNRAEAPRIGRSNNVVGGIRVVRQAPDISIPSVLCERNPLEILGGTKPAVCAPGLLSNNMSQWLLWPLQRQDAALAHEAMQKWWPSGEAQGNSDCVKVTMLAHNPRLNYYVFCNLGLCAQGAGFTELERSFTAFNSAPLWLDAAGDWDKGTAEKCIMIFDVVFVAMYVTLAALHFVRFLRSLCRTRCRCSLRSLGIWMFLDAVIVAVSVLLTVTYFYCVALMRGLVQLAGQLPALSAGQTYTKERLAQIVLERANLDMPQYLQQLDAILEQATRLQQGQAAVPWFVAVLAICLCLRPCRAFKWSPRFAMLQKTVSIAISDLAHTSFVIALLLVGFALVGYTTFGMRVRLFSTIGDSFNSTFLFLWGFALDRHRELLFETSGAALVALAVLWAMALNIIIAILLMKVFMAATVDAQLALMGEVGFAEPPAFLPQRLSDLFPARSSKYGGAAPGASDRVAGAPQAAPGAVVAQASRRNRWCGSLLSGSIDDRLLRTLEKNSAEVPPAKNAS